MSIVPQVSSPVQYFNSERRLLNLIAKPSNAVDMVKDPTIALARQFGISTLSSINLSSTLPDDLSDDVSDFIYERIYPLFYYMIDDIAQGVIDYGFAPFYVEYDNFFPVKIKSLLPTKTQILIDKRGDFLGFMQQPFLDRELEFIPVPDAVLFNINQEGDYYYGRSLLDNASKSFKAYSLLLEFMDRYNHKLSGHTLVIKYPPGIENKEFAESLAAQWTSTGIVQVETREIPEYYLEKEKIQPGWSFEILEARGSNHNFLDYAAFYHKLFCRAFLIPERAVLEGQFGTRAESTAHQDVVSANYFPYAKRLVRQFKEQIVNPLLVNFYNINPETIKIEATFKDINSTELLEQIVKQQIPTQSIDYDAVLDKLNIPKLDSTVGQLNEDQTQINQDRDVQ